MSKIESAAARYEDGLNCAQSVLTVFGGNYGIDEKTAKRLTSSFGGGLCQGDVCGAVAAAIMILGLHFGSEDNVDPESKKKTAEAVKKFSKKFKTKHQSIQCRDLLSRGLRKLDKTQLQEGESPKKKVCVCYVEDAVKALEEVLSAES